MNRPTPRANRRLRGYVLAEALVSAAIATLAGGLSVMLLVWAARSVWADQDSIGALRVLERVYEESRLLTPRALQTLGQGTYGQYRWMRIPGARLDARFDAAPVPVRLEVWWTAGGQPRSRHLDALIAAGGVEAGTPTPKKPTPAGTAPSP